jgi:hypothetical protein
VYICTGYGRDGDRPYLAPYYPNQTAVFLMAVGRLKELCHNLEQVRVVCVCVREREREREREKEGGRGEEEAWTDGQDISLWLCVRVCEREREKIVESNGISVVCFQHPSTHTP